MSRRSALARAAAGIAVAGADAASAEAPAPCLRILIVISQIGFGGAEMLCVNQALWLHAQGQRVSVFVLHRLDNALQTQLLDSGIEVIFGSSRSAHSAAGFLRLTQQLRRNRFDVIHVHLFPGLYWMSLLGHVFGLESRLLFTEHNTWNGRRIRILRGVDGLVYRGYREVVCISESTRDALLAWQPGLAKRCAVDVIENGIDVERFAAAQALPRPALGLEADSVVLMMVGTFRPQKDHPTLIRALAQLGAGFELLLAGDGPTRAACEKLAASLGIAAQVHFLGPRADVEACVKAADLYVQSSSSEGFGLAAAEAMAAGRPVLYADLAGVREVIGDAGRPFRAGDAADLAACVRSLLSDPAAMSAMAQRASLRARQFSYARMFERYLALYRRRHAAAAAGEGRG